MNTLIFTTLTMGTNGLGVRPEVDGQSPVTPAQAIGLTFIGTFAVISSIKT
jgi:hypothetical protein